MAIRTTDPAVGMVAVLCSDNQIEMLGWCPRRDSNSHDRSRGILSPLRLPIPPLGPDRPIITRAAGCQINWTSANYKRSGAPNARQNAVPGR